MNLDGILTHAKELLLKNKTYTPILLVEFDNESGKKWKERKRYVHVFDRRNCAT